MGGGKGKPNLHLSFSPFLALAGAVGDVYCILSII
jgi:hypothetical protein